MVQILDQSEIPTRFLIISDTHGASPRLPAPLPDGIDVLIHCGNLTLGSKLTEFTSALALLSSLNAPLKLVIPGPHDWTLDDAAYEARITEATTRPTTNITNKKDGTGIGIKTVTGIPLPREAMYAVYGKPGQARQLFLSAKVRQHGIFLMVDEGRWDFPLANNAALAIYASPWTLSPGDNEDWGSGSGSGTGTATGTATVGKGTRSGWGGGGGFQYTKAQGHTFDIRYIADVVITRGSPLGILDVAGSGEGKGKQRVGCPDLFAAVAMCRPRMHCFGHVIHNAGRAGWGARLVKWRDGVTRDSVEGRPMMASHFTDIDHGESFTFDRLGGVRMGMWLGMKGDSDEKVGEQVRDITELEKRVNEVDKIMEGIKGGGCCRICTGQHCEEGVKMRLKPRKNTLFVNAALALPVEEGGWPWPWVVEIELPKQQGRFS